MTARRDFTAVPAVREAVPLLIGLTGGPGAGKTFSALTLASGIRRIRGGDIVVIDTEAGRARRYAGMFDFRHVDFRPPFNPDDFLDAVRQQLPLNPACIIVDSMSDEHEGEGGVLDIQMQAVERLADQWKSTRDAVGQAAWKVAKEPRKRMMNGFLQITVPLIFCFRAREKTRPIKTGNKTVPTNIGWQPIAPSEIVHSMDIMCVLPLKSDGVPMWHSDKIGEDFVIKLPEQFKSILTDGRALNADMGEALARWAAGDDAPKAASVKAADVLALGTSARDAAEKGSSAYEAYFKGLGKVDRKALLPQHEALKKRAAEVDAEADRGEAFAGDDDVI